MVVMMMLSIGETAKAALNSIMLNIGEETTLRASIATYNIIYSKLLMMDNDGVEEEVWWQWIRLF